MLGLAGCATLVFNLVPCSTANTGHLYHVEMPASSTGLHAHRLYCKSRPLISYRVVYLFVHGKQTRFSINAHLIQQQQKMKTGNYYV